MLTKPAETPNSLRENIYCISDGVDILVGLGLTSRQSRVYLALITAGSCGARVIARLADIHRQEVYSLLIELQQFGLVRQNMTVPISYTPLPLIDTIELLLEEKTNDLSEVTRKAKQLVNKLSLSSPISTINLPVKPCFGVVSQGERGRKYQATIEQTQCSIDALISWVRFKQLCFHFERQLKDALKREVIIRILTEKPPNHHLPKWVDTVLQKYSTFQVKTLSNAPEAAVTVFDHTQIALAYNSNSSFTEGPDFWSSHQAFLTSYEIFFNSIWANTKN